MTSLTPDVDDRPCNVRAAAPGHPHRFDHWPTRRDAALETVRVA